MDGGSTSISTEGKGEALLSSQKEVLNSTFQQHEYSVHGSVTNCYFMSNPPLALCYHGSLSFLEAPEWEDR
jgi:hypothetical protein